ncbi:antitoxin [Betaproteobacteria bacterium]|nr:antitoxin [Betaproteobacteria bacterium]
MENILYPAIFDQQPESHGGGYCVRFVDIPEAITEGDSLEEALFNASEALSGILSFRVRHGQSIPDASQNVVGAHYVAPDVKTQAALLVRSARGDKSLSELARALQTSWPAAQRLEDPSHWPSLKTLDRVASALGKKLVLSME